MFCVLNINVMLFKLNYYNPRHILKSLRCDVVPSMEYEIDSIQFTSNWIYSEHCGMCCYKLYEFRKNAYLSSSFVTPPQVHFIQGIIQHALSLTCLFQASVELFKSFAFIQTISTGYKALKCSTVQTSFYYLILWWLFPDLNWTDIYTIWCITSSSTVTALKNSEKESQISRKSKLFPGI